MAMNIKDHKVHELARELAERKGTTMTRAVKMALEEALTRSGRSGDHVAERLDAISRHCAALPLRDARTPEEILGYDERGLPG
ncbi:MAG: type II toxin-antitoxin system VapB family antitoxin [Trueperaceae bacterium]|nr:type II toxin-antitoxin system VapB family antitoxin [Trueperaceae bacterium]